MLDPTYPLFPIVAFTGFVLALVPLPWHLQAWNSGTCFYMMWASISCLNQFVNSVVWADNALNVAPMWCDISIRIMMGASVGLPAASLCINRRLYYISNSQTVTITHADKLRSVLVDTMICVVFPLAVVALQYVVQGHRFDIFENIGCYPALYNTLLAYFISLMWPIVIGLTSAVYCVRTLRAFARRRLEFGKFLSSNKSLTVSRYFRLMALAMADILFTTPPAIFIIWLNASATVISPWRSWEDTHYDFGRIEQLPAVLWRSAPLTVVAMEFSRWVTPMCALVFFAFFGFADEARKQYRRAFWTLVKPFGWRPSTKSPVSVGQFKPKPLHMTSVTPSLPPYSPPSSSLVYNNDLKRSASLTSLAPTLDGSSTRYSHDTVSHSLDAWPIILHSSETQSSSSIAEHSTTPYPPIAGSIV